MSKVDKIFALQNTYNFLLLVNFLGQGYAAVTRT